MKNKKIIVTGGAGFIGSHLVDKLLEKDYSVTVLDNFSTGRKENLHHVKDRVKIIECDISKTGNWSKHFKNAYGVFHLAALADIVPSITNPDNYFKSNVIGTYNILNASYTYNIKKLIYSASSSCYGIPRRYPTKEISEIKPEYPYALTKKMGEDLVLHWEKVYKIPAVSLRFFNVYGTRSRTSGTYGAVLGVFLAQKINNKPFTVVGDGEQTRDFTYVTDVANALLMTMESKITGEIFNIGSGKTVSINYLTELLEGRKVYIPKRPGEPDITFADIAKIKKKLNWKPTISIEMGVKEILKNIDYWKDAPVWTPKKIQEVTKVWFQQLGNKVEKN